MEERFLRCECLSEMLGAVGHRPTTRKADLLAVAWSRHVWVVLGEGSRELVEALEESLEEEDGRIWVVAEELIAPLARDADGAPEQGVQLFEALPRMFGYTPESWSDQPADELRVVIDGIGTDYRRALGRIVHEVYGNPFRPVTAAPSWRTSTALDLAREMYESRDFTPMPILADALQDAGCDNADVLDHCRQPGEHVRGCWVVDAILGKS